MILDPRDEEVAAVVAKHGWSCQSIEAGGGDPAFVYSVGFWETLNAPEFIMFGLDPALMHGLLWGVFRQIKAGASATEGKRWSDLLDGYDCITLSVHPNRVLEYFGFAQGYYRHRGQDGVVSGLQLVWPGKGHGLFPWQDGCSEDVRRMQPRLDTPKRQGWIDG